MKGVGRGELMQNQRIVDILRAEVDLAREEYLEAKRRFWEVCAEAPSGLPHPDGSHPIEVASRAQTANMIAYTKTLTRFNQFLLNGTIPEDLKDVPETKY